MDNYRDHEIFLLLTKERAAIINGQFETIDSLASSKEVLFDSYIQQYPHKSALPALNAAITRNQVLLQAAIKGVASAKERLQALRDVREGLRIYDYEGQFETVASKKIGLSKRF